MSKTLRGKRQGLKGCGEGLLMKRSGTGSGGGARRGLREGTKRRFIVWLSSFFSDAVDIICFYSCSPGRCCRVLTIRSFVVLLPTLRIRGGPLHSCLSVVSVIVLVQRS